MEHVPGVSVIVPLYRSEVTLRGFLDALERQSYRPFETVLVDSSPTGECAAIVAERSGELAYHRSPERLLPQAARLEGLRRSTGELVVFTDPDTYASPDWLERLVAAHRETGHTVAGALACHGRRWLDRGVHLCKFSKWLPAGPPREVDMCPTAGMLVRRSAFEACGGFGGDMLMGDTTLSRNLRQAGGALWFEPRAAVEHHHLDTFGGFLRERYLRGRLYGELRTSWLLAEGRRPALLLAASVLPVRIFTNLFHAARHAARAGVFGTFLSTFPVVAAGFSASILGEALAYARGTFLGRRAGDGIRSSVSS